MNKASAFIRRLGEILADKDVFFNASAISFNLFLFSIPFTLLIGSLIGYLVSTDIMMLELTRFAKIFLPEGLYDQVGSDVVDPAILFEGLIQPLIDSRRSNLVIGVSILTFTSLGLFRTLKHVIFRYFDGIEKKHRFSDFLYAFLSFGIVGSIFVFFSYVLSLITLLSVDDALLSGITLLFTLLIFYVLYRYLGERSISRQTAMVGALMYTVLFQSARIIFGFFLTQTLSAYESVYQGYAILLILALWTFYMSIVFVISTAGARAWQDVGEGPSLRSG